MGQVRTYKPQTLNRVLGMSGPWGFGLRLLEITDLGGSVQKGHVLDLSSWNSDLVAWIHKANPNPKPFCSPKRKQLLPGASCLACRIQG